MKSTNLQHQEISSLPYSIELKGLLGVSKMPNSSVKRHPTILNVPYSSMKSIFNHVDHAKQ
ncbi:hypothetical protein HMPREF9140_00393 [Prevotella micans F0438]|uniref:Uncharacterized protein n=1 Tax=Prevotella micans F0438 TaxID=883158 RepID=H1Q0F5_9BACT|nr:hypothetical protein [Prevotella micans]EHO73684.1 hypothetical protein HMPREF9140_00393 [Prevotella micans F0438]